MRSLLVLVTRFLLVFIAFILLCLFAISSFWLVIYERSNAECNTCDDVTSQIVEVSNKFITDFLDENKRLPTLREFDIWKSQIDAESRKLLIARHVEYHTRDIPKDLLREAGNPSNPAYFLMVGNKDYDQIYFASWYKNASVGLTPDKLSYLGQSKYADYTFLIISSVLTFILSFVCIGFAIFSMKPKS